VDFDFSDVEKQINEITKKDKIKNIVDREVRSDDCTTYNLVLLISYIAKSYELDAEECKELRNKLEWTLIDFIVNKHTKKKE